LYDELKAEISMHMDRIIHVLEKDEKMTKHGSQKHVLEDH